MARTQDKEVPDTREGVRSFNVLFAGLSDGDYHTEASEKLHGLIMKMRDEAIRVDGKVKGGKFKLEFDIEIDCYGVAGIGVDIQAKPPKMKRVKAQAWITAGGNLTLQHPKQLDLGLRQVETSNDAPTQIGGERTSAREV